MYQNKLREEEESKTNKDIKCEFELKFYPWIKDEIALFSYCDKKGYINYLLNNLSNYFLILRKKIVL